MSDENPQWARLQKEFAQPQAQTEDGLGVWRQLDRHLDGRMMQHDTITHLLERIAMRHHSADARSFALTRFLEVWFENNVRRVGLDDPDLSLTPWLLDLNIRARKLHVLVVAVNDGPTMRDGLALMKLGTLFPSSRFDGLELVTVAVTGHQWTQTEMMAFNRADLICFVGQIGRAHV